MNEPYVGNYAELADAKFAIPELKQAYKIVVDAIKQKDDTRIVMFEGSTLDNQDSAAWWMNDGKLTFADPQYAVNNFHFYTPPQKADQIAQYFQAKRDESNKMKVPGLLTEFCGPTVIQIFFSNVS